MADLKHLLAAALADRYRIERELGQGGMATVYPAEDLKHIARVALKVLRPGARRGARRRRFLARDRDRGAACTIRTSCRCYDSGDGDGFLFYVMPLVEGESLRERLERERQLPIDEALRIAREVADALPMRTRRVVHRDIKPENILLAERPRHGRRLRHRAAVTAAGARG